MLSYFWTGPGHLDASEGNSSYIIDCVIVLSISLTVFLQLKRTGNRRNR